MSRPYQSVQAAHAAIDFQHEHHKLANKWHKNSNYLIFLTVDNLQSLEDFIRILREKCVVHTVFREPDLDYAITAVAIEPGWKSKKLTQNFKLLK